MRTTRLLPAAMAVTFAVSACAQTEGPTPEASEDEAEVPAFETSAQSLGDEIVDAAKSQPDLGEYESIEEFRHAVAEFYVEQRLRGADPVMAEAQLAGLYTDDALDEAGDRWTKQVDYEPSDFVYAHRETMDADTVSFEHSQIDDSEGVHVTWSGQQCSETEHQALIVVYAEDIDGEYRISGIPHRQGCGCGMCVA